MEFANFFGMEAKGREKRAEIEIESFRPETVNGPIGVPKQARIVRIMDVRFNDGGIDANVVDADFLLVFHARGETTIDGLPGFRRECFEGGTEQRVIDGFFFVESAEVLKGLAFGDAEGGFAVGHGFDLHDEEGAEEVFAGEVWRAFFCGVWLAKIREIAMSGREDFGIFFKVVVEPLVFFTKLPYNFGRLGFAFIVLKEIGQHDILLLTHCCLLEFVVNLDLTSMIPMRLFLSTQPPHKNYRN